MHRPKLTALTMTLLAGSLIISGCKALPMETAPLKPVKPTLSEVRAIDGMVCFPDRDATKLGLYILALERGYQ